MATDLEKIKNLREVTGEGLMACNKAFFAAGGDLFLAIGVLRSSGLLVNIRGDRAAWERGMAQSYADHAKESYQLTADGLLERKPT